MAFKFLLPFFLMMISGSLGNPFILYNNCKFPIWPGNQGHGPQHRYLGGGGMLGSREERTVMSPNDWSGKFWARTSCGASEEWCMPPPPEAGGVSPLSLAEITLSGGTGEPDFYRISLVDGFNLPIQIKPIDVQYCGLRECKAAFCLNNLNNRCPDELAVKRNGQIMACKSACSHFGTDQYCCRGDYGTSQTCNSQDWPVNYPGIFKSACPDACTYPEDTFTIFNCYSAKKITYRITFCP